MKKTALVTMGSLFALVGFVATAATQTGCKLTITDCGDSATCLGGNTDGSTSGDAGGGGGGDSGGNGCTGLNNVTFEETPTGTACDTCMGSSCCSQVTTCFADTNSDCAIVYKCLAECDDRQKCEDDCKTKVSQTGVDQLNAVVSCLQASCDSVCPTQPQ